MIGINIARRHPVARLLGLTVQLVLVLAGSSATFADDDSSSVDGQISKRETVTLGSDAIERLRTRRPNIDEILESVHLERIVYRSDGLDVMGYLAQPRDAAGPLPVVIYNRGGNREFGALSDARAASILGAIASWGYVVVGSQYRGNAGGEGQEEFGGRDVHDVLNLVRLIDRLPTADSTRIGMYGWSRGGMMTYLALTHTDRIAAAIIGAGPTDAFETVRRRPTLESRVYAELVPGWPEHRDRELEARSAIRWVDRLDKETPLLLLHGSSDWRVHPTHALRMATALFDSRHPFRFVFFEGGDHGLSEHRREVDRLARDWLNRYVRDGEPWPSLKPHGR